METNTLHDKLDGLPWLTDPALRLEALLGFTVVAAPQGPMGPKYLGTLTSWEVHDEDRLICVVDTADGPEVECYHYDVVAAAGILTPCPFCTPEGLSREDEYVVAGAAQTLDGDPPFSEEALLAVGGDLLAIVRRLTKEPK